MAETADVTAPVLIAVSCLPGALFYRQNAGTFLTLDGARVVKVTVPGIGDIMGAYCGWPVAIETKTRKGRMRLTQIDFRVAWIKAGGIYIIARSPEEALAALAKIPPK